MDYYDEGHSDSDTQVRDFFIYSIVVIVIIILLGVIPFNKVWLFFVGEENNLSNCQQYEYETGEPCI